MAGIGVQEVAILYCPYPTIQETDLQKEIFPLLSTNIQCSEVKRDGIVCELCACDLWTKYVLKFLIIKKAATSTPSSDSYLDPEVFACTVRCLPPPLSHPNQINRPYHQHNHNHQHDSFYHQPLECTKCGQEGCPWKDFAKCSSDALTLSQ